MAQRQPHVSPFQKRLHVKLLRRLLSCLPHVKSASIFVTDIAFCCFKRGRKGRPSLAEHANNPLQGMEFEMVAKADFT
jgi:hypothetical protein